MTPFVENLKKDPLLLVGIAALIFCLGFVLLSADQPTKLSAIESELNLQLDKINLNTKHSANIEAEIQQLETLVETINERLFIDAERSTNIDFFYSFEERMNIVISEVQQLDRSNPRFSKGGPDMLQLHSVVDYAITVRGTFHEIMQFLHEIYQMDTIARITEFQINSSDVRDYPGRLSAKIRVAVLAKK